MAKRDLYLETLPVEEAFARFFGALEPLLPERSEEVDTAEALGRATFGAIRAVMNSPIRDSAAMDGIAVVSSRTRGASEASPIRLALGEDFREIDTGDPIRPPYDAVVMAEDVQYTEGGALIRAAAAPWQYVRPVGEDIAVGEMILPGGFAIRPADIGALLSGGIDRVRVWKRPKVAILPTGDELRRLGEPLPEDGIVESNSAMLAALVAERGGVAHRLPVAPDDEGEILARIEAAVECYDFLLICAGTSAGRDDYAARALSRAGELIAHGVAMKPGKPVALAVVREKPVVGIPGYPVSAYLAAEAFVSPFLLRMSGRAPDPPAPIRARLSRPVVSSLKYRESVRVALGRVGGETVATPLHRGAGSAMSLVRADGFLTIERNREGIDAGEYADVTPLRRLEDLDRTAVVVGSHDLILDELADIIPRLRRGYALSCAHAGSMGGLIALRGGEAHLAPIHIPDDSGEYNLPILRSLFPDREMALIKGVGRVQGILVKAGNPLGIRGVADLPGHRYVNRQRGAGTRMLFDLLLKREGIEPEAIEGYRREAATHMAVAAAVASGAADAGMGVRSAASSMGLSFIPVGVEEYDFALPREYLGLDVVEAFLAALRSDEFGARLDSMDGYEAGRRGEVRLVGGGRETRP